MEYDGMIWLGWAFSSWLGHTTQTLAFSSPLSEGLQTSQTFLPHQKVRKVVGVFLVIRDWSLPEPGRNKPKECCNLGILLTNDSCLLPGTSSNLRRSKNRYTVLWLSISWRSHKTSVWGPANNRCPQGGTLEAIASTGYSSNHHSIWDLGNSDRPRRMKIYPP